MARTKAFDEDRALDEAMTMFWCAGYHATTIRDLTGRLGINPSSLYSTFGDKQQLFAAALTRYRQRAVTELNQMLAGAPDARTAVRWLLTWAAGTDQTLPGGCFLVNATAELAAHDPAVAEITRVSQRTIEAALAGLLETARQRGETLGSHPPLALARTLFTTMQGLKLRACGGFDEGTAHDVIETTLALLD